MGRSCGGFFIAVASACGGIAACTFGINTDGLTGGGDASVADASHPVESGADARTGTGKVDASSGTGTGTGTGSGGGTGTGTGTGSGSGTGPATGTGTGTGEGTGTGTGTGVGTGTGGGGCTFALRQAVPGGTTGQNQYEEQSATTSQSLTDTAGDLLVVIAYGGQSLGVVSTTPNMTFTVNDELGNKYYAGGLYENSRSSQAAIQIFYAPNIAGGANKVTVTSTTPGLSGTPWTGVFLQEYSGLATIDVVDVSSGQMAPAASTDMATPGNMTTSSPCDLVVGAFTDGNISPSFVTPGAGWTLRSLDWWDPGAAVDNVGAGSVVPGVVDAVMVIEEQADNGWVAAQMAFRAAAAPALAQPTQVVFTTSPQTLSTGACSAVTTLTSELADATVARTATGIAMTLSGPSLQFFADSACAFPITGVAIGAGTSSASFYWKATVAESPSITAHQTVTGANTTQQETVN